MDQDFPSSGNGEEKPRLAEVAEHMRDDFSLLGESLRREAEDFREAVYRIVDEHPYAAMGAAFGGNVIRAPQVMHGKTSEIHHDTRDLFQGVPNPFTATRYHSLIVEKSSLPDCLEITAWTDDDLIMGLRHRELPIVGVQFHPESVLTPEGPVLVRNFLQGRY